MDKHWLYTYLLESYNKNLCTTIHCTTCGAMEFRQGVIEALPDKQGQKLLNDWSPINAISITKALAELQPIGPDILKIGPGVRCILFDIWRIIGEAEMEKILSGTWAGEVLRRMQEHYKERMAAILAQEAFEAKAQHQRAGKKRLKQEQHQQRLNLKKERDKIWFEKHGKID